MKKQRSTTRVAFISQWFSPEPTVVPDGIARALRRGGAQVEVLTGVPNYPTGVVLDGYSARRASMDSVYDMAVRRTPLYPSHDGSTVRRILNYVSWAASSSVFGARMLRRADVNVVYGSPITAALPALTAKALWRKPFVLVVQDVWPDSVFATGFLEKGLLSRVAFTVLTWLTELVYRHAVKIVVISPGMKILLTGRGVPSGKLEVIHNWVDESEPTHRQELDLRADLGISSDDFVIMYAGNHGPAQSLAATIEALAALPEGRGCHLVMVGEGVEKHALESLAGRTARGRVHFVGAQPRESMPAVMRTADAQLVSLADRPLFSVTIPSKLQAVMAEGHPVLAVAAGDVEAVILESGGGVVAAPGDVRQIARAIQELRDMRRGDLKDMGVRGRTFYQDRMSEDVGTKRYAQVLSQVMDGSRSC